MTTSNRSTAAKVGVGLRHPHYEAALADAADIDFVEVHAENFYVDGGANLAVLERALDEDPLPVAVFVVSPWDCPPARSPGWPHWWSASTRYWYPTTYASAG